MAKTETELKRTSTKKTRAKFLFNDGEFRHRVVEMKKKKKVEQLREEEIEEEYKFFTNHIPEKFHE
jgi:hypothetical protein